MIKEKATGEQPCSVKWCVALAVRRGQCIVHLRHGSIHPRECQQPRPVKRDPQKFWPTPWDDKGPWYERCQ